MIQNLFNAPATANTTGPIVQLKRSNNRPVTAQVSNVGSGSCTLAIMVRYSENVGWSAQAGGDISANSSLVLPFYVLDPISGFPVELGPPLEVQAILTNVAGAVSVTGVVAE